MNTEHPHRNIFYSTKLMDDFGVSPPPALLNYQAEEIYKYGLNLKNTGNEEKEIAKCIRKKLNILMKDVPWRKVNFCDLTKSNKTQKTKRQSNIPDGTLVFDSKAKPGHQWQCYYDGRIVAKRKDVEKLKSFVIRKFNIVEFFN